MNEASGSEVKVFSTKVKKKAVEVRSKLLQEFPGNWYFLFNLPNKSHEIRVANAWGGKLSNKEIADIKEFIKTIKRGKETKEDESIKNLN